MPFHERCEDKGFKMDVTDRHGFGYWPAFRSHLFPGHVPFSVASRRAITLRQDMPVCLVTSTYVSRLTQWSVCDWLREYAMVRLKSSPQFTERRSVVIFNQGFRFEASVGQHKKFAPQQMITCCPFRWPRCHWNIAYRFSDSLNWLVSLFEHREPEWGITSFPRWMKRMSQQAIHEPQGWWWSFSNRSAPLARPLNRSGIPRKALDPMIVRLPSWGKKGRRIWEIK